MKCSLELLRTTSKIVASANSGRISCARKLFDEMSQRDSVAWNAMLASYSRIGQCQEALALFWQMRTCETRIDHFTFTAVLSACSGACDLRLGAKVHALIVVSGFHSCIPVNNALIDMYGKCFSPCSARRVFEEMSLRNEVTWCSLLFAYVKSCQFEAAHQVFSVMPTRLEISWNIMISGYAQNGDVVSCLALLKEMLKYSYAPDQWTFSSLMKACSESSEFRYGFMVHGSIVKSGWSSTVEAMNSLISFYTEVGCYIDVTKILKSFTNRNQLSWNAIIDASMKLGDTEEAFLAFQQAPEKNIVSWTSMISGYVRNGHAERAASFFVDMTRSAIIPDDLALGATLHACSSLAILGHGRMIHGSVICHGFDAYVYVGNGLVNMYAKCGDLEGSSRAFRQIPHKDIVSWNIMLFAFGLHGQPYKALKLYKEMAATGVKPDKMTFIGLFVTCSHSGLIEESRVIYEKMRSVHGLPLEVDHVMCMVDMLGRGGHLDEAKELATKYVGTTTQEIGSYEAVLRACAEHQDVRSGTFFGKALKDLEPDKEMSYVLLSNLYCASGQWKEAEMIRKAMIDKGVKKMPGCSWIEVRNKVTAFVAGNHSYPQKAELRRMINILEVGMRNSNFLGFVSLS